MKRLLLLLAVLAFPSSPARAVGAGCQATAGGFALEKLQTNATGPQFVGCINRTFDLISSSGVITGSTTTVYRFGQIYVSTIGGNPSSNGINISSYVYVVSGASVTLQGAGGYLTTSSSVTASAFFGNGANLTSIGTAALSDSAVTTPKLATDAVTSDKILTGAATTDKIGEGAIGTGKIQVDAVTAAKIINAAVTTAKLAADAVTAAAILDGAVTTDKIGTAAVTNAKTVGTTATCAVNQYLSNATYTNGLPSGGSCATAGTGSGDAVLSATQTFSGGNIFTSSVTIGAGVYTTTATFNRVGIGIWTVVASTPMGGSAAVSFTNLTATATYRLHWQATNKTADGTFQCWWNGENAAGNYKYVNVGMNTSALLRTQLSAGANTAVFNAGTLGDEPTMGYVEFWHMLPSRPDRILWVSRSETTETATGLITAWHGGGQYTTTVANNGRLDCSTTGGTMTGKLWIEAMLLNGGLP